MGTIDSPKAEEEVPAETAEEAPAAEAAGEEAPAVVEVPPPDAIPFEEPALPA